MFSSVAGRSPWRAITVSSRALSIRQIADRLGRSQATIKAYFYDPTGEKRASVAESSGSAASTQVRVFSVVRHLIDADHDREH